MCVSVLSVWKVQMCVHACRGQRTTLAVIFPNVLSDKASHWPALHQLGSAGGPAKPRDYLPSPRITSSRCQSSIVSMGSGTRTQVLMITRQAPCIRVGPSPHMSFQTYFTFKSFKDLFIFLCMSALSACMSMCHVCAWCLRGQRWASDP